MEPKKLGSLLQMNVSFLNWLILSFLPPLICQGIFLHESDHRGKKWSKKTLKV